MHPYKQHSNDSIINDPIVMDYSHPSQNKNQRITHLVMHYTVADLEESLKILTDPLRSLRVSAHYLVPKTAIDSQRKVFNLVANEKSAWHAGISGWGKHITLNNTSIGIEIVNAGLSDKPNLTNAEKWEPFSDYQMETVISLSKQIVQKYNIEPTNVVGHSDIALPYGRKQDPGPAFDWEKLYKNGVGAFYNRSELDINEQSNIDIEKIQDQLQMYGYRGVVKTGILDENTRRALSVFQMHFRPSSYSGEPDPETAAILKNLLEKYHNK
ncbi:N-acetylmuramoyl-L-alanine amidase [Candidatus Cardinium hertigii]|uniref:N-acetylmuramoyl-L-alanine amidase n=1 Tax=Candidatus Cardinium hertigii TaxID=247481 RepID=UPI003D7D3BC5